jgi:hypothetical protein
VDYAPSARGSRLNFVRYQSYKKTLRSAVNLQLEQALLKNKVAKIFYITLKNIFLQTLLKAF